MTSARESCHTIMPDDSSTIQVSTMRDIAGERFDQAIDALRLAVHDIDQPKHVHRARVTIRRAQTAARLLAGFCPELPPLQRKFNKRLKRLLRLAGEIRQLDVLGQWLATEHVHADQPRQMALELAMVWATDDRIEPAEKFVRAVKKSHQKIRKLTKRILQHALEPASAMHTLLDESHQRFRDAAAAELKSFENLHMLRLSTKRFRYAAESLEHLHGSDSVRAMLSRFVQLQDELGRINDACERAVRFDENASRIRRGAQAINHGEPALLWHAMDTLAQNEHETAESMLRDFITQWNSGTRDMLLRQFDEVFEAADDRTKPSAAVEMLDLTQQTSPPQDTQQESSNDRQPAKR